MENIKAVRVYILRNINNSKLFLYQGFTVAENNRVNWHDESMRWMIKGTSNPMPVRNGMWFSGFSPRTMLDWFLKNGYKLAEYANISDISANPTVCTTKGNDEPSQKGNESFYDSLAPENQRVMNSTIQYLYANGNMLKACVLYKVLHGCAMNEAINTVREMHDNPIDF